MSKAVETVFGGTNDSAQDSQKRANERTQNFIEEQSGIARGDANRLFGESLQSLQAGNQAALDALRKGFSKQAQTFKQGNIGAQEQLLQGQRGVEAAILGLASPNAPSITRLNDFGGFIPGRIPQTPQFTIPAQAPQPQISPPDITEMLGGNVYRNLSQRRLS